MKNKYYPNLASPITIKGLTFKNRILGAPMSNPEMDIESNMRKEDVAFHENRAMGGLASVAIGLGVVSLEGRTHTKEVKLYDSSSLPSLKEFAKAMHRHNANAVMELQHGGRYANARAQVGADAECAMGPNDEINSQGMPVKAMTEEQIIETAKKFGQAAAHSKAAGIDMVLIHMGHGWLPHQFISPAMNKRTDKWGGSLENRMRFPLLIVEEVRKAVGDNYPIEARISGAEFSEGGYTIEEGVEIAKMLDGKVDIIHVSAGVHENPEVFGITHPSMFLAEGCNVFLAAEVKKHVKTPVATLGGLTDVDQMEEIIASGKADIIEVARQSLADPYFVEKAFSGRKDEIIRCCRCFTCFYNYLTNRTFSCAFNPVVGNELECKFRRPATTSKKVVVVGGGPGGMQAAITAAERGHSVSIYEKCDRFGGQLLLEEHIPFKQNMYNFIKVLEKQIRKMDIEVHLGTELTAEQAEKLGADVVMVAVGASPIIPTIDGIKNENVMTIHDLHKNIEKVGEKVAIIGGGLVGCECGIYLDGFGKDVTIVEMNDDFAVDSYFMHKDAMKMYMKKSNMKIRTSATAKAITKEGLVCQTADGEITVPADTIFVAAGMKANRSVAESFYNTAPRVFEIGDGIKAGRVAEAVSDGYYRALDI